MASASDISFFHLIELSSQQETRFVYENFRGQENLYLDGSARVLPSGLLHNSRPLSFSTHFVCALVPQPGVEGGHGMAFVVSPSMDFSHAESTRYLGIFNVSKNGSPSSHVLAVELDTIWNPDFEDIDHNHVGIDVNSPLSDGIASASYFSDIKRKNESINLLSGNPLQVWVDYEDNMLNVSMAPCEVQKPSRSPLLSQPINLSDIFPNRRLFVGFSAATGTAISYQYILSWSFSTSRGSLQRLDISRLPEVPHPRAEHKNLSPLFIVLLGFLAIMGLCTLTGMYFFRRSKYAEVTEAWEKEFGAHRFSYKSLYKATKGFNKDGFLGRGGFGEVYRGNLFSNREIAVKRMSHDGDQGVKQFVAEVVSMRCLKHRNLVPLLGYCRRKHELLLVSEYMPNGSLDEHLFDDQKPVLSWRQRLVIIKGIAYLHSVTFIQVRTKLFCTEISKLQTLCWTFHDHGGISDSTCAVGTIGYMAPDILHMGASTRTDEYAFGVFMVEVACGRRPVEPQLQLEKRVLIEWVYESRPTMEQVVLYLNKNLPLPDFSPYTVGISNHSSVLIDAASLVASRSWSAVSSANNSP
ncbi:hypothetical protein ARALYDRAFT_919271 [Arabidopsis lyrata subsp. lyrata]|uniref:non-specific serine/threonine protein kinase n=1 Tax=Arabidopsis lyrata subsp. lyrata TaxID=81972 RepID=D7MTT5_ARALL|nr:hypothetical protein ARALYDRAFT_919271 [Arabidopsis lyrata subsp. lyrata]